MKPSHSNSGPLQIARRRLRAVIRRHPVRAAALGTATLLAGGLALVILQAHTPQADEMTAGATNMTSPETEVAESVAEMLASAKPLPVAESPQQQEARTTETEEATPSPSAFDEARWSEQASARASGPSSAPTETIASSSADRQAVSGNAFAPPRVEDPASTSDPTTTAAISPRANDSDTQVDVAETEAQVAAFEQAYARREAQGFALVAAEGPAEPGQNGEGTTASMANGTGTVDRHVNLRAEADNEATILAVVPQNGEVAILDDCPNWCAVEYEGHQGYIFGTFIEREEVAADSL